MENQRIPAIYLRWLQQNTEHYLYRTEEAERLREKIEACGEESEEDLLALNEYYLEFVRLFERNPLCGTNAQGEEAAILSESFYYFLYENDHQQYIPMKIFLDYGGVEIPEDAQKLYNRMLESLNGWEKEARNRRQQKKERTRYAARGVTIVYGRLLNQSRGSTSIWLRLLLMLCLLIVTGYQVLLSVRLPDYKMLDDVVKLCIAFGGIMTVIFTGRSFQWIRREKRRKKILKEWDYCVKYTEGRSDSIEDSFRDSKVLRKILKREILEAARQKGGRAEGDTQGIPQREPDYIWLLTKKNIRACNTIRLLDIICMAFVFLCVLMASPVKAVPVLELPFADMQAQITAFLDCYGLRENIIKEYAEETMTDIQSEVQFSLRTLKEEEVLLNAPAGDQEIAWCKNADTVLYPLEFEWDESTGTLWYYAADTNGYLGYVMAASSRMYDNKELFLTQISLTDLSDNLIEDGDGMMLFDGSPLTGCMLQPGDQLELRMNRGSRIQYMYLVNGDASSEEAFQAAGRVKTLKLVFDETQEFYVELEDTDQYNPLGHFVRIPDIAASRVRIQIVEVTDGKDTANLSELKICGKHMQ